jgi:RNA polymerase sigma-70 factor (ECF subfamily)
MQPQSESTVIMSVDQPTPRGDRARNARPHQDDQMPVGISGPDPPESGSAPSKSTPEPETAPPNIGGADAEECDDGTLAKRVAQGDQEAATILINRYQPMVRSFMRRTTGRADLADDLAQETFVRLLRYADRFDPKYPMKRWLFTIARRLSINYARRADQRVVATEYLGMASDHQGPQEKVEKEDQLLMTRQLLNQAMEKLNETQRAVLVLFHHKEMSIQDVAEVMDMPTGTVKSHLHRARAAMRKTLEPQIEGIRS